MRFAQEYSAAKGWNFADLKVEQMLEIRDQEGWRTLGASAGERTHEGCLPARCGAAAASPRTFT
jgi:hypothetical protein